MFAEKNPYAASDPGTSIQLSQLIRLDDGIGVDFELIPSDLEAFFQFHYLKKADFRKAYLIRWSTVGVIFMVLGVVLVFGTIDLVLGRTIGSVVILFGVLYTVFFPLIYRKRIKRLASFVLKSGQNLGMSGSQHLRFVSRGISQNNPAGEFLHYWICVEAIEQTSTHAFIYVSGLSAVILPKRIFESASDFHEMLAYANEKSTNG